MLIKQDVGINPYVANNGSRDQSLTGIGGLRVYVGFYAISSLPEVRRIMAQDKW